MGVLGDSWCFCSGGGKSERMKAAIFFGKGSATARISVGGGVSGSGFLIHRNLLLTTHVNLPSVSAAGAADVRLQSAVGVSIFPHRWGAVQGYPLARKALLQKQRSFIHGRRVHSQGGNSQRSNNEYYSPTVPSIMKKRTSMEQPNRPRPKVVHSSSPRWNF